jgi:hypothetical protein
MQPSLQVNTLQNLISILSGTLFYIANTDYKANQGRVNALVALPFVPYLGCKK